jgi:hypothetical protein
VLREEVLSAKHSLLELGVHVIQSEVVVWVCAKDPGAGSARNPTHHGATHVSRAPMVDPGGVTEISRG